jgi:hypothetical protein
VPLSPIAENNSKNASFKTLSHVHQNTLSQYSKRKLPLNFVEQYNIKLKVGILSGLDHLQIII